VLLPDVILKGDIVTWPMSFLVGFVFFAAFIGKMGETIASPLQKKGINLVERLKAEHTMGSTTSLNGSGAENAPLGSIEEEGEPKKMEKHLEEDRPLDDPIDERQLNLTHDRSVDLSLESEQAEQAAVERRLWDGHSDDVASQESSFATGTESSVFSVKMESLAKGYVD